MKKTCCIARFPCDGTALVIVCVCENQWHIQCWLACK